MATVGDNLRANIRIGGTIDPSWKNSVNGLKKGLSGATREVARLTRQQDVLKKNPGWRTGRTGYYRSAKAV